MAQWIQDQHPREHCEIQLCYFACKYWQFSGTTDCSDALCMCARVDINISLLVTRDNVSSPQVGPVSDVRILQAASQAAEMCTLETAQEGIPQTAQVLSALTPDQSLQATHVCPQISQTFTSQTLQVLSVQTVPSCAPPQSDVRSPSNSPSVYC